jgi:hypothetical protein
MQLVVVSSAERNGKLAAYFASHGFGLGELQVMSVSGRSLKDQAWLWRHEC